MTRQGDTVGGDKITARDVEVERGAVAIGREARAEVHYHYQYVERAEPGVPYLPPSLPPHHVPREAVLAELQEILLARERHGKTFALYGMGGVGKTTVATAFCHGKEVILAFPDGILWATLGPEADLLSAQAAWGSALGEDLTGLPDAQARASRLRDLLHKRRCLLVIDDVWDRAHLLPMQVGGPQCVTLVTTREYGIAQKVGAAQNLDMLEPEQALALLAKWTGGVGEADREDAAELAQRLGYLPLALALAGAQVQYGETWASLLAVFRHVQGTDITLLDLDDASMRDESLLITFDLSLNHLRQNPETERLPRQFAVLGAFAAGREAPFTVEAAAAVWQMEPGQARRDLGRLARAALLSREGDSFFQHLLLGDYARRVLAKDKASRKWAEERHGRYYLQVAKMSVQDWEAAEAALPQMRVAWGRVDKEDAHGLFAWPAEATVFLGRRGHWQDYSAWTEAALLAAQMSGERLLEGWCQNWLGHRDEYLGRLDEALAHFQAGLRIFNEIGSPFGQAAALSNMGRLHDRFGELGEALALYQASLSLQRAVGLPTEEAITLNNIGEIYRQRGELDDAMNHYRDSLRIRRNIGDRGGEAAVLNNMGMVYVERVEPEEALAHYRDSLCIWKEVGDWAGEAVTRGNIGVIHFQQGDLREALAQFRASVTLNRKAGSRAGEANALTSLGDICFAQGELREALTHYQASRAIWRELGNRAQEALTLNNIGGIYYEQDRLDLALAHFQDSLAIRREVGDRSGEAVTLWNIGVICERIGSLAEAEGRLVEALALAKAMGMPEATDMQAWLERVRSQLPPEGAA